MSDIAAVQTHVTKSSSGNAPAAGKANDKSGTINFFDLITQLTSEKLAVIADNVNADAGPATDETALAFDLSGTGTTTTLDAEGLKTLKAALDNLLHGLPADQKPVAIKLTGTQLQKIMQDIKTSGAQAQDGEPALITTGLTPEQLTKLSDLIARGDAALSEDDDSLKAILVGILKLVPDEDNGKAEIFLPKTLMVAKEEKAAKPGDKDDEDTLACSLSSLITGNTPPVPPLTVSTGPMNTSGVKEGGLESGAIAPEKKGGGFGDVLKLLEQIQAKTAPVTPGSDAVAGQEKAGASAQPGAMNSTTGMSFGEIFGGLSSDSSLNGMFPDGLDWSRNSQYGLSNVQPSGPAQLTSLVTQASATQSHPATQVVAATLARTFEGGETKAMTLRLDPPELGKIEIQMQFTKDKSVKTHMVFEKPETMLMMQRDSRALELAMQNAGMDAGGNTLSFELGSQSNNAFTHGQGGNNGGNGANRSADGGEPQLIETTMSWSVDSNTGLKHYNALV
ncbi:MAG: flagellar hook-length control domain protein [Micavibrio sp.]|nr:flagellar hook-length control domain protein [Micavibrio sp.]